MIYVLLSVQQGFQGTFYDTSLDPGNDFPKWLYIIGIVLWIIFLAFLFRLLLKDIFNTFFAKQVTDTVTISSVFKGDMPKRSIINNKPGIRRHLAKELGSDYVEKTLGCYVTFYNDKNKYVTLEVPKFMFEKFHEKDTGILTYKGDKFISYENKEGKYNTIQ